MHVQPNDPPTSRCGKENHTYNPYKWGQCPYCITNDENYFYLGCKNCRNEFHHADSVEPCPKCESGNTVTLAAPEQYV